MLVMDGLCLHGVADRLLGMDRGAVGALVKKNPAAKSAAATIGNRRERFVLVMAVFIIDSPYFTKGSNYKANNSGYLFAHKWLQSVGKYVT